jgi:hypothetical protein
VTEMCPHQILARVKQDTSVPMATRSKSVALTAALQNVAVHFVSLEIEIV